MRFARHARGRSGPHVSRAARRLTLTLAIGSAGAATAEALGLPAGLLAGALAAVAIAAIAGAGVALDSRVREVALVLLGAHLGSAVTPETLRSLPDWPLSLAALGVCVAAMMVVVPAYLRRTHGFESLTAMLSAVPGNLGYVLAVAIEARADERRIAMLQTLRVALLLVLAPVVAGATLETSAPSGNGAQSLAPGELVLVLALCTVAALVGRRLRMPAGAFLAAMLVSGVLHGAGLVAGRLPAVLASPALVVTGCAVGASFAGVDRWYLARSAVAGLAAFAIAASLSLAFALPVARVLDLPFVQVWLAFSPGGMDTMTVLAFALGVDPVFVAGHQIVRFLGISVVVPFLVRSAGAGGAETGGRTETDRS